MSRDEKQTKKPANNNNLNIGRIGVAALPAMHNGRHIRSIESSAPPAMPWGMPPSLHSTLGPELKPQMRNPFYGPALGLMSSQGQQNTQMENPFFGPFLTSSQGQMMGLSTKKGGGFTYNPWNLQIDPEGQDKRKSA